MTCFFEALNYLGYHFFNKGNPFSRVCPFPFYNICNEQELASGCGYGKSTRIKSSLYFRFILGNTPPVTTWFLYESKPFVRNRECQRNIQSVLCLITITAESFIAQSYALLSEKIKSVSGSYQRM